VREREWIVVRVVRNLEKGFRRFVGVGGRERGVGREREGDEGGGTDSVGGVGGGASLVNGMVKLPGRLAMDLVGGYCEITIE
jgi:hypothetical protein